MLAFAASYDGQGAIAMQAGRDYTKLTGDSTLELLTLVRFGRFEEILPEKLPRGASDYNKGAWYFAQGYARLRTGDARASARYLARLQKLRDSTEEQYRVHPVERLLGVLAGILEGETNLSEGDTGRAIAAFEKAVEQEDALDYDEPEPLPFAARHWLGAGLLEAKRYEEAERVYREELEDHPRNGWALYGLREALVRGGRSDLKIEEDLEGSWERADFWLDASRQ